MLDSIKKLPSSKRLMSPEEIKRSDPVVLAYIGDTLYDLYVRTRLSMSGDFPSGKLHKMAVRYVCAGGQAKAFESMQRELDEEERAIAKRGRNAKAVSPPRNCEPETYAAATAFEAVLGYLYLCGRKERLECLLEKSFDNVTKGGT